MRMLVCTCLLLALTGCDALLSTRKVEPVIVIFEPSNDPTVPKVYQIDPSNKHWAAEINLMPGEVDWATTFMFAKKYSDGVTAYEDSMNKQTGEITSKSDPSGFISGALDWVRQGGNWLSAMIGAGIDAAM